MADLTNIPLSSFVASNKKENCFLATAQNLARLLNEIGCPVSVVYALSGSVTSSVSSLIAEYGEDSLEKTALNFYISVDKFDPDADQIEYVAPVSDINCGLTAALCKDGVYAFNSILALAERYSQALSAKPGHPPFNAQNAVLGSPNYQGNLNAVSDHLLNKYGF